MEKHLGHCKIKYLILLLQTKSIYNYQTICIRQQN